MKKSSCWEKLKRKTVIDWHWRCVRGKKDNGNMGLFVNINVEITKRGGYNIEKKTIVTKQDINANGSKGKEREWGRDGSEI